MTGRTVVLDKKLVRIYKIIVFFIKIHQSRALPLPKWNAFPKPSKFVFECEFIITFGIHSEYIHEAFQMHSGSIRNAFGMYSIYIWNAFRLHSECIPVACPQHRII